MKILAPLLLCLCLASTVRGEPPLDTHKTTPPVTYEITGTVVSGLDGAPVSRCHLTWEWTGPERERHARRSPVAGGSVDADDEGHFSFTVSAAGRWTLRAVAPGFVSQLYEEHGDLYSFVVTKPETPKVNIRFTIQPESSILGTVLDEAGEPIRNAQVTLLIIAPSLPDSSQNEATTKATTQTDDRGIYEFANLKPGSYQVKLVAQPWYAASARSQNDGNTLDPSLDVVYPVVWFPGVTDPGLAETMVIRGGDSRQANMQLSPIPSGHLRIEGIARRADGDRSPQVATIVRKIDSSSESQPMIGVTMVSNGQGQIDMGGLSPGLYEVQPAGTQSGKTEIVEVSSNARSTVDISGAIDTLAKLTVQIESPANTDSGPQRGGPSLRFISADHPEVSSSAHASRMNNPRERREQRGGTGQVFELPPGRYEVNLDGSPNLYLTGLTATGAETAGRFVTLPAGNSSLVVHISSTEAQLRGIAATNGVPSIGATIFLVPTTVDDPNSMATLRREQTNSDGSFELQDVRPGKYILMAIKDGWQINWADPVTLRRYLTLGVPIEIGPESNLHQDLPTL